MEEFQTLAEANKNPELENSKPLKEFINEILIIDQLGKLKPGFEEGKKVKVKPVQEKQYHKFEDVE